MRAAVVLTISILMFCAALTAKEQGVPTDFQPPQVVSTVEPSYPANVVAGGTVVLKVKVSSSGTIEDVQVLQEASGFMQSALDAVRKWKFEPAHLDGKPVAASIPVAFSFSQPIVWWNRQAK